MAIYLLGLAEILDVDLGQEVRRKMDINRRRRYGVVDGVWQRLEDGSPGKTRKQRGGPHGLTCRGAAGCAQRRF